MLTTAHRSFGGVPILGLEQVVGADSTPVSVVEEDEGSDKVVAILREGEALHPVEAEAILRSTLYQHKLRAHLGGEALTAVEQALDQVLTDDAVDHLFD
jgi:hypothetical protein